MAEMFLKVASALLLLYATADSLIVGVRAVHEVREKRSDDGGPLQAVVDQLSQQVNSLTAQLAAVNAEVAALKTQAASQDTVVAFSAWSSTRPVQAVSHGTIILNHAATNIGNAYDTTTGVFTAPVSGLYDFQATIMPNSLGHEVYATIVVDNARVAMAVADTDHDDWDQSTLKAVVHVNAGQKVRLKNGNAPSDYHAPYTTFSGILVKAD